MARRTAPGKSMHPISQSGGRGSSSPTPPSAGSPHRGPSPSRTVGSRARATARTGARPAAPAASRRSHRRASSRRSPGSAGASRSTRSSLAGRLKGSFRVPAASRAVPAFWPSTFGTPWPCVGLAGVTETVRVVRPPGFEPGSPAPEAGTLSVELWAQQGLTGTETT